MKTKKPVKMEDYASGSKTLGTTLKMNMRKLKQRVRKTRHEPTYIFDNADRTLSKKIDELLKK